MEEFTVVHEENIDGFDIELAIIDEDTPLEDVFDDSVQDLDELNEQIESGEFIHFIARVRAKYNGHVLGEDFLGSCLYVNVEEFYTTYRDDYYMDMVYSAIHEAKKKLLGFAPKIAELQMSN